MVNNNDDCTQLLRNLRELRDEDEKYLSTWIDDQGEFRERSERTLPWIWHLQSVDNMNEFTEENEAWEFQGTPDHICFNTKFSI
jgi:hypothetical protein